MERIRIFQVLILSFTCFSGNSPADESVWLLIDTKKLNLQVIKGVKTIAVMENISIGRNGAGIKTKKGDDITPKGTYKIKWVNNKSRFYKFYGFDYPSVDNANDALKKGYLNSDSFNSIIDAHKKNKIPPQNTALGGIIGIHGLGSGDKKIHGLFNWTHGCIALTNKQIDSLDQWLGKGIVVKIK